MPTDYIELTTQRLRQFADMPPEQWGNVVEFVAYGLFGPRPAKGGR